MKIEQELHARCFDPFGHGFGVDQVAKSLLGRIAGVTRRVVKNPQAHVIEAVFFQAFNGIYGRSFFLIFDATCFQFG